MKIHEVAEWLLIADDDAETADMIKEKKLANAYYHCSQAIEKYLKSYLVANDKKVNKNHDVSETLIRCIELDNSFTKILPECNQMTQLIKNLRYPGRMIPTKENIKDAFCLLDKVKELKPIQDLYNNIIEKYGDDWKNTLFQKVENIDANNSKKS